MLFCQEWSQYPGAVEVWKRNFNHVEQLFDYGSAVRKVMYTTNTVESINSSFRKVTKKGAFPNENALLKLLYLRITELYKKWNDSKVQNWAMVRNQLSTNKKQNSLIRRFLPKGKGFDNMSANTVADIENWINDLSRKIFNYHSSKEMFDSVLLDIAI